MMENYYEKCLEDRQKTQIITKHLKSTTRGGRSQALYEQVIQRDLLRKLDSVFLKHEEFQIERASYAKRLVKIQADIEAIHNEYRRDNLQISSKIQDLNQQLSGIDKQLRIIYEDYGKRAFGLAFKSCKIIDNLELHSNKCVSNCEDLFNKNSVLQSKHNTLCERANSAMRRNKIMFREPMERNHDDGQLRSYQNSPSSSKFKTRKQKSREMVSFKLMQESSTKFKRKITKTKKKQLRQSLDAKIENPHQGLPYTSQYNPHKQRNPNRSGTGMVRQGQSADHIKSQQSQVSFKTQYNEEYPIAQEEVESQIEDSGHETEESKRKDIRETKVLFDCISNLISKAKQTSMDDTNTLENLIRISLQEEKIKQIGRQVDQNSNICKELYSNIVAINGKCQTFVLRQKYNDQIFSLKKEVQQLREYSFQNFANKKQTRQALLFLQKKIRTLASEAPTPESQQSPSQSQSQCASVVVSKCLGCNRVSSMDENSTKTSIFSSFQGGKEKQKQKQKKISVKDLKKRTMDVLKNQKVRAFSKFQKIY